MRGRNERAEGKTKECNGQKERPQSKLELRLDILEDSFYFILVYISNLLHISLNKDNTRGKNRHLTWVVLQNGLVSFVPGVLGVGVSSGGGRTRKRLP